MQDEKTSLVVAKRYMLKEGDDLRQDQLIVHMIILMDSILKRYGLDLRLTPYQVIAASTSDGFIEFVHPSATISSVLDKYENSLMNYWRDLTKKKQSAERHGAGAASAPASAAGSSSEASKERGGAAGGEPRTAQQRERERGQGHGGFEKAGAKANFASYLVLEAPFSLDRRRLYLSLKDTLRRTIPRAFAAGANHIY